MRGRSASKAQGKQGDGGLLRNNLAEHLHTLECALHGASGQSPGFIYSQPGQNPNAVGVPGRPLRPMLATFVPPTADFRQAASKAWRQLLSIRAQPRTFMQPGVTPSIPDSAGKQSIPLGVNAGGGTRNLNASGHAYDSGPFAGNKKMEGTVTQDMQTLGNGTEQQDGEEGVAKDFSGRRQEFQLARDGMHQGVTSGEGKISLNESQWTTSNNFFSTEKFASGSRQVPCSKGLEDSVTHVSDSMARTEISCNKTDRSKPQDFETSWPPAKPLSSNQQGKRSGANTGVSQSVPADPQTVFWDDDELLETLDLDELVTAHYEKAISQPTRKATTMDGGSAGMFEPKILPSASCQPKMATGGLHEAGSCCHGVPVQQCREAPTHLQEKKDRLIAISNELLDKIDELSAEHGEELRLERKRLNKEIQFIERTLGLSSPDEDRRRFSSSAQAGTSAPKLGHLSAGLKAAAIPSNPQNFSSPARPIHNASNEYPPGPPFKNLAKEASYPPPFREPRPSEVYSPSFSPASGCSPSNTWQMPAARDPGQSRQFKNIQYSEGTADKQWTSKTFPWTRDLVENNWRLFGNRSFRPNQREIMNATLSGRDVFVLMPTGGGKSLTYQLPAVCVAGLTLVVSPLVSLIMDQIMHLEQANIVAAYMSANQDWSEQQRIFSEMNSHCCKIKLLYVTPEKIARSDNLSRHLESLYRRDLLSRIVIDEAHCVSQWGHDFRPDYQGLGILKQKFPEVPLLALTATATHSVKEDVLQALSLTNCVVFKQTFNRPNLRYEVRPKNKKCMEEIDKFIRGAYYEESGIVYCLSRNDCEKVAQQLRDLGHKAAYYHGNMEYEERNDVQRRWSKDEINIICATVAFGMGINKPDVRFVIHHSIPKSIEGYHQESGRAGRDNQPASCLLMYTYGDYIRVKHMLVQGAADGGFAGSRGAAAQLETNLDNLHRMVAYCENEVDCRRTLQLAHFGERFDSAACGGTCDTCSKGLSYIEHDVTEAAKQLIEIIRSIGERHSLPHILDIFRGSNSAQIKKSGHDKVPLHGAGQKYSKSEADRILHRMVAESILLEDVCKSDMYGSISSIVKVNEQRAREIAGGRIKLTLRFPASKKAARKDAATSAPSKKMPLPMNSSETAGDPGPLFAEFAASPPSPATVRWTAKSSKADEALAATVFAALKELRQQIVSAAVSEGKRGLTPHHVFSTGVLQQISKIRPTTIEELQEIPGIGKVKANKYGKQVLELIQRLVPSRGGTAGTADASREGTAEAEDLPHMSTPSPMGNRHSPAGMQAQAKKRPREGESEAGWKSVRKDSSFPMHLDDSPGDAQGLPDGSPLLGEPVGPESGGKRARHQQSPFGLVQNGGLPAAGSRQPLGSLPAGHRAHSPIACDTPHPRFGLHAGDGDCHIIDPPLPNSSQMSAPAGGPMAQAPSRLTANSSQGCLRELTSNTIRERRLPPSLVGREGPFQGRPLKRSSVTPKMRAGETGV